MVDLNNIDFDDFKEFDDFLGLLDEDDFKLEGKIVLFSFMNVIYVIFIYYSRS